MCMKVLLTGGAGYIGAHTALTLLGSGHEIVVADNYSNSSYESMARVKQLSGKDFPVYEVDVCDKAALEHVFQENNLDAVIHFAGLKAVGESVAKPLMYYRNNLDSTLSLLELMTKYDVKKFVFSSSATVYGQADKMPLTEDEQTGASNPYGWTKYMIEQILRDVAHVSPDWSIILLRYFNPVGAHESGMIGEDPNGIPNNLMPRVLQAACGKLDHLGVFGTDYPTPDGTCVRDYIHVMDLAKGHEKALGYLKDNHGVETVNLGTGIGYSVLDIIKAFNEANDMDLHYTVEPRRPGDAPTSYADPTKAKRLLGWQAEKTLHDMCKDAWNWQKKNPNGYGD